MGSLPTIAITLGEPAGVGPEVAAAALRHRSLPRQFRYEVLGSTKGVRAGKPTDRSARQALAALEEAATGAREGRYAAVVTGPVQKETLVRIGFAYPGQTEFFAARAGVAEEKAVMAFWSPRLCIALLSTHCSLRAALRKITPKQIRYVTTEMSRFLQQLGVKQPRIALAGINPHASEHGLFGHEEARLLEPIVAKGGFAPARISGPYAPDTVYWRALKKDFDAVIAAYHDQGLIPFKLVAFHDGVNVTLGLPIIRTSPDHGTALDLAGTGKADPRSMLSAIRLAARLAIARTRAIC